MLGRRPPHFRAGIIYPGNGVLRLKEASNLSAATEALLKPASTTVSLFKEPYTSSAVSLPTGERKPSRPTPALCTSLATM